MTDTADDAGRALVAIRLLDASRELVWKAFSQPEHLARWWGPKGFRNTIHQFEFRVGGAWKYVMHGPDGANYPNQCLLVEISEPSRIVFDHVSHPKFVLTFTFAAEGEKTRVTMHQLFESVAACNAVRGFAAPANHENLERLAAEVAVLDRG